MGKRCKPFPGKGFSQMAHRVLNTFVNTYFVPIQSQIQGHQN